MRRLRFWIAILSIWLIFFFNIERILFQAEINIIRSDTYIFVAFVAFAALALPRLRGLSFTVPLIGTAALFLILWYNDPGWENNVSSTFDHLNATALLTIIQVNAIILTGLLARQISYSLVEFENVIASITFGYVGERANPFSEEQSEMYREIKRARRFERPLSVMAFKVDESTIQAAIPAMIAEVQQAMMKEFTLAGIAQTLNQNLHSFDLIALWDNYFILVLPETAANAVPHIGQRLEKAIETNLGVRLRVGSASLPDQGMTFEGLVKSAMANADRSTESPKIEDFRRQILTREV